MSVCQDNIFEQLPVYSARQFLPENINLTQISEIKAIYEKLQNRTLDSVAALEQWILDRSEFESALDQCGSILYIQMTCQTNDAQKAKAYTDFIEHVVPAIKPLEDELNKKFLKATEEYPLDEGRYGIYVREIREDVKLFREENVELQTQVDLLSQEYQTVCGAMMVEFDGKEQTMPQMSTYAYETDRDVRERAWLASTQRRLQDKEKLEEVFDKMLKLRHQIALNAGFKNFRDYKFKSLHRFDYTPEDCKAYHRSVEKLIVPIWKEILERRQHRMALDPLRPWDTAVDPSGRAPLKPFDDVSKLMSGCQNIFNAVDLELGAQFEDMLSRGLLDLASRKGKAPGGYQSTLSEARKPFIFMNAVGVDDDVRTLLHEAGHAFHSLACAAEPIGDYRHGPMEFNEVASMAMELLGGEHMSEFYNEEDVKRSTIDHLEGIVFTLVWVATIDAFQHWLYENPEHTPAERQHVWLDLHNRFGAQCVDWSGLEEARSFVWHRQLHIFEVPFYYIEYGIAQLGALQVWRNSEENRSKAIEQYRAGLALGGARSLPDIYTTAGIQFDFSEATIKPLVELVQRRLEEFEKK